MPSLVDRFQRFVDNHLQVVRIIPPLLGFSGLFLISKHYYLFTRFRTVSSVPVEVFTRRLRLRGIVRSVEADGEVQVEHIPRLAFFNNSTGASRMPLLLPLTHSEKSVAWMRANLPVNSRVRFVLLGKSDDSTRLIGLVFYRRTLLPFYSDVSKLLLRDGLASLRDVSKNSMPHPELGKYRDVQTKAVKKHKGIWKSKKPNQNIFARAKQFFTR